MPHRPIPEPVAGGSGGRETPTADYHRAIVRVGRDDLFEPGASYSGTGTFVAHSADRGLVLTASHVVDQGGGRIWVDFGRGRQTASLLGRDANLDLAAAGGRPSTGRHSSDSRRRRRRVASRRRKRRSDRLWRRAVSALFRPRPWLHRQRRRRVTIPGSGPHRRVLAIAGGDRPPGGEIPGQLAGPIANGRCFPANQRRQRRSHFVRADFRGSAETANRLIKTRSVCQARAIPPERPPGNVKLAGILWGGPCDGPQQAAYETHATCCIYIRRFLEGIGVQLKPRRPPAEQSPSATPPSGTAAETAEPFAVGPDRRLCRPRRPPPAVPQVPPPGDRFRAAGGDRKTPG